MPALTYTVTDPVTGEVFKSRRKSRPHGAVIVDGPDGPRVDAWAGRPDLLDSYHRRAVKGTWHAAPQPSARVALATESHPVIRARLPRTLAALASHPWVESIDDARGSGDGLHVYLRPGFVWAGTASAVIETTVREACQAFRDVAWDPEGWAGITGADTAEVAALTGEAAPAPRPVLPGEAIPPPAPSHGDRAPRLPELCPATPGTPTRAVAVRDVERRDGGGVAVICSDSPREAFRLPDTVSLCGAAAALEAGGWVLSPALEALARRWRDISGDQDPSPEAVAIAEAAAPQGRRFEVFHRTWWRAEGVPGVGESHHIGWAQTEARARHLCRRWNATHTPGPLSDRAEYSAA